MRISWTMSTNNPAATEGRKRSLAIAGHRTSVSLEPEFWDALGDQAKARGKSVAELVAEIDPGRGQRNLSSAIRVSILNTLLRGRESCCDGGTCRGGSGSTARTGCSIFGFGFGGGSRAACA